ncbi:nitrogen regulation protein NR(II) [Gilvimarinus sp. F26214L]|uniref:nitrogen regulation protein NR(II) n=1 Tax=Gilvimarinus sp. DZF01 TaxID=3461371 RepID=UPI00404521C3
MRPEIDFRLLFENLTSAVLLVDEKLLVHYINPAAEALLGVSCEQASGSPLVDCFFESERALEAMRDAAQFQHIYTKRQVRWHLPTGQSLTVDYSVSPLGHGAGLLVEAQHLDRLLRISREEATTAAQETTRNLVRGMAHEIKNPLGGIRGAAQLLARELPDRTLEEYTQIIIQEADRLRKLVDKMLGPHQPAELEEINIHEVTERVAAVIRAESGGLLKVDRDYDPSIPLLPGDKEQLIQAILNVARNAWEALEDAGMVSQGEIRIRTRVQRQFTIGRFHHPLVCRVDVIDNGPGIPAEIVEEIFYPMISGRAKGTGLGLAISQQLISQHLGLIACRSEPGRTEFSIYIPIQAQPIHPQPGKQQPNRSTVRRRAG